MLGHTPAVRLARRVPLWAPAKTCARDTERVGTVTPLGRTPEPRDICVALSAVNGSNTVLLALKIASS